MCYKWFCLCVKTSVMLVILSSASVWFCLLLYAVHADSDLSVSIAIGNLLRTKDNLSLSCASSLKMAHRYTSLGFFLVCLVRNIQSVIGP